MRKFLAISSGRAVLTFLFIVLLAVFGDVRIIKAEESLSVVGEWEVVSVGEYQSNVWIGQKLSISRKGDGYEVMWLLWKTPWMFTGNDKHIVYTEMSNLSEFTVVTSGTLPQNGVPQQQVPIENCYTLSADGNFLTREQDSVLISSNNGTYTGYSIHHGFLKRTLKRISTSPMPAAPTAAKASPAFAYAESRGEFYFFTKDGRKVTGEKGSKIPLEEGTKVVTGKDGHVQMVLPDETIFTIGPDCEIEIDKFVYDPDLTPKKIMVNMTKGVFRWVTGKVKPIPAYPSDMKVTLPVVAIGIRGTDFEATVAPDGSGSVVLNFGQLEITEKKTGFTFVMDAGQKITFGADGSVSRPMKAN